MAGKRQGKAFSKAALKAARVCKWSMRHAEIHSSLNHEIVLDWLTRPMEILVRFSVGPADCKDEVHERSGCCKVLKTVESHRADATAGDSGKQGSARQWTWKQW